MSEQASFLQNSSVPMTGKRVPIPSRRTGPGWSSNSNVILRCRRPRCLPSSVSGILIDTARHRIAPCGGILPDGEPCMGQRKTSSLNRCISRENERNPILPIWKIWESRLQGSHFPTWSIIWSSPTPMWKPPPSASARPLRRLLKASKKRCGRSAVCQQHRTDHLSAAVRQLRKIDREDWTVRYQALMAHYGMQPTWNNTGVAHENGDVEQSHHRFKQAVDQAL